MGRLEVGTHLNSYLVDLLPVGTVMVYSNHQYRLTPDRMWERVNDPGHRYGNTDFNMHRASVHSLPDGLSFIELPTETVGQYKWRFREHALANATQHGVSYAASEQALRDMGAGPEAFPLGAGMRIKNPTTARDTPDGTVMYTGRPDVVRGYVVWQKSGGRWVRLLGEPVQQPGSTRSTYTVASINGDATPPAWLTSQGTEEDEKAIAEFKATAWRRGWQLKREQSWCGTYESVMSQFGLTREVLRTAHGVSVGGRVSAEAAANLPVGTLLGWMSENNPEERVLMVRTNAVSNVARTVKIGGSEGSSGRNYHSSMILVSLPADERGGAWSGYLAEIQNASPWRRFLPVGTTFTNAENGSFDYVIEANEGARQTRDTPGYRRWNMNDFGVDGTLFINRIEGVAL